MTPAHYQAALDRLDLSQGRGAALFGVDPRTSRRWVLGESPIPRAVEIALALMLHHGLDVAGAEAAIAAQFPTKPRRKGKATQ